VGSYVREWSNQYGIDADFHADLPSAAAGNGRPSRVVETNLYRIVQEALNNVLKHAEASHVSVLLHQREGSIALVIEDNGRGFDSRHGSADTSETRGLGLTGMQERAAIMKGDLEIESRVGQGTTILASVPLAPADLGNKTEKTRQLS
jgi:signal transduction histidine kinase